MTVLFRIIADMLFLRIFLMIFLTISISINFLLFLFWLWQSRQMNPTEKAEEPLRSLKKEPLVRYRLENSYFVVQQRYKNPRVIGMFDPSRGGQSRSSFHCLPVWSYSTLVSLFTPSFLLIHVYSRQGSLWRCGLRWGYSYEPDIGNQEGRPRLWPNRGRKANPPRDPDPAVLWPPKYSQVGWFGPSPKLFYIWGYVCIFLLYWMRSLGIWSTNTLIPTWTVSSTAISPLPTITYSSLCIKYVSLTLDDF